MNSQKSQNNKLKKPSIFSILTVMVTLASFGYIDAKEPKTAMRSRGFEPKMEEVKK